LANVFTPRNRDEVRTSLLDRAHDDSRVTGAAVTGSAARGAEDRWSDVDIYLGIAESTEIGEVVTDWTRAVYEDAGAVDHWDVRSGEALYRVFLLRSGLQVDIAFAPESGFGARGVSFRTVFGQPVDLPQPPLPRFEDVAGLGWLGVLHANAAIERCQPLKAEYWISSIRDQTLALACLRHGESPAYATGIDRLPEAVTAPLEDALVTSFEPVELRRALRIATRCLLEEIRAANASLGDRLEGPLVELAAG
jgi:hypothetical protein